MWQDGDDTVIFECTVAETGKKCLTGGWVKLAPGDNDNNSKVQHLTLSLPMMKSDAIFHEMAEKLKSQPDMGAKIGAIFRWIITAQNKDPIAQWGMVRIFSFLIFFELEFEFEFEFEFFVLVVDAKSKNGLILKEKLGNSTPKADCTLTLSDDDMFALVSYHSL
jgi:hypothetical protein